MSVGLFRKLAFAVWNGYAPQQGPKALSYRFDFATVAQITDDLFVENTQNSLSFVQSVYIDNNDNDDEFVLTFAVTNQRIVCQPNSIQIFPVFAPDQTQFTGSMPALANRHVDVIFLNVPMPLTSYGPVTVDVASVTATFTPTVGAFADHSSTIAAGGTSQALFAANPAAIQRIVQNPISNNESIFINFGGVAATTGGDSIEIAPGGEFATGNVIDDTAWTIISATTGTKYVAKEMV